MGPCADSSAPVPGSLVCARPPPSPPDWGVEGWRRDAIAYGLHCQNMTSLHEVTHPLCSSGFIPGPAYNHIWESLRKAPWLRDARSRSLGLSCASDISHLEVDAFGCAQPQTFPKLQAQQPGRVRAQLGLGCPELNSVSCRAQISPILCCLNSCSPFSWAALRNPDTQCSASPLSSSTVLRAAGCVPCHSAASAITCAQSKKDEQD